MGEIKFPMGEVRPMFHDYRARFHGTAHFIVFGMAVLVSLATVDSAAGFPLTNDEEKCANGFIGRSASVVVRVGKQTRSCHGDIGDLGGGGTDVTDCVMLDDHGQRAAEIAKLDDVIDGNCSALPYAMTCPQPCETIDDAGATTDVDDTTELKDCLACFTVAIGGPGVLANPLLQGIYGAMLDNATVPTDSVALRCQQSLIAAVFKVYKTKMASLKKCFRSEYAAGTLTPPEICISNLPTGPKVLKAIAKLDDDVTACTPPAAFDGGQCAGLDGTALTDCLDRIAECRVCRWANGVIGSAFDCDSFDNGLADASCLP
jgi:hypothetical protein